MSRTTAASTTFVASSRPPRPASTTATSTPRAAKSASAAAVRTSNCVAPQQLRVGTHARSTARSKPASSVVEPLLPAGDVRRGVRGRLDALGAEERRDGPRRRRLALRADDVDRLVALLAVGRAGRAARACARARSRPPARARASSATQSVADCIELAPVALELLALRLDHLGRRVRDEALVREHALARAISLRSRSRSASTLPFAFDAVGLDDRVEDALLVVALEHRDDAASGGRPAAASCTRVSAPASASSPASGHGATIRRVSRAGRFDQISSVTCGITGCSSLSSRSSAAVAVARASASPS